MGIMAVGQVVFLLLMKRASRSPVSFIIRFQCCFSGVILYVNKKKQTMNVKHLEVYWVSRGVHLWFMTNVYRSPLLAKMTMALWGRTKNMVYNKCSLRCHHGDETFPEEVSLIMAYTDVSDGIIHLVCSFCGDSSLWSLLS